MCVAQLVRCYLFFSVDFSVKVALYEVEVTQKPLILCVCEREKVSVCVHVWVCVYMCVCTLQNLHLQIKWCKYFVEDTLQ